MFGSVLLWVRVAAKSQAQRLGIALSGSPKENGEGRAEARQVCGVTEQPSRRRQAWAELSYNTQLLWAGLRALEDKAKETGPVCRILGHRVSDDSQLPASHKAWQSPSSCSHTRYPAGLVPKSHPGLVGALNLP